MEQRTDDTDPVIRRRLEVYKKAAQPVEAFYEERGKLLKCDCAGRGQGKVWTKAHTVVSPPVNQCPPA